MGGFFFVARLRLREAVEAWRRLVAGGKKRAVPLPDKLRGCFTRSVAAMVDSMVAAPSLI
jgi:hypothetical protein